MNIPLISEYKKAFILRRLLMTFFGQIFHHKLDDESVVHFVLYSLINVLLYALPALYAFCYHFILNASISWEASSLVGAGVIALIMTSFPISARKCSEKFSELFRITSDKLRIQFDKDYGKLYNLARFLVCTTFIYVAVEVSSWDNVYSAVKSLSFSIVIYLFVWFTICNATYALMIQVPPETAAFTAVPTLMDAFNRVTHVMIIILPVYIVKKYFQESGLCFSAYVTLTTFPLLWIFGILPPVNALVTWFLETTGHLLYSLSTSNSWKNSAIQLLISSIFVLCSWKAQSFIFSTTFGSMLAFLLSLNPKILTLEANLSSKRLSIYLLSAALFTATTALYSLIETDPFWSLCVSLVLFTITIVLLKIVNATLIANMFSNIIYTKYLCGSTETASQTGLKGILNTTCLLLVNFVCTTYASAELQKQAKNWNILVVLASFRIYKCIYGHHFRAVLSFLFAYGLRPFLDLHIALLWMLCDFILIVGRMFLERIYMVFLVSITSITIRKQRLPISILLCVLNVIFFPLVLGITLLTCIVQINLMPLFTLPLFLPSFPRPAQFWPRKTSRLRIDNFDGIYYEQFVSQLMTIHQSLPLQMKMSSAGWFFILRFEDRLLWVEILGSGYGYVQFLIKGLELQETSCHALEATEIDDAFGNAFPNVTNQQGSIWNKRFWYTMQPVDYFFVKTYLPTRNVLTGIVDSPHATILIKGIFSKALLWIALRFRVEASQQSSKTSLIDYEADREGNLYSSSSLDSKSESNNLSSLHPLDEQRYIFTRVPNKSGIGVRVWEQNNLSTYGDFPSSRNTEMEMQLNKIKPLASWTMDAAKFCASRRLSPQVSENMFTENWLQSAVKEVADLNIANEGIVYLNTAYRQICGACYTSIFSEFTDHLPPPVIYNLFKGSLPKETEFMNAELLAIVVKALRYSIKIALDQLILQDGAAPSDEELIQTLSQLDTHWFIGLDNDDMWKEAVAAGTPHLFSMDKDPIEEVLTSHSLTLTEVPVYTGCLNSAVVHGTWCSLSLELLYLTNDDDERYSIQANPATLRNITIQAADVPFGYPIYVSETLTTDILY